MKRYDVKFETDQKFFLNTNKRQSEILAIVMFKDGKILVSTKSFYPKDCYRLPTGGVKNGEKIEDALVREVWEETGIKVKDYELITEIYYEISGRQKYESHIFLIKTDAEEIVPQDLKEKISDSKKIEISELKNISENLDKFFKDPKWGQWARFRKLGIDIVYKELSK